jgi:hypothetical protein
MTLSREDIVFVYSGGLNNSDPLKSIGGRPSENIILGVSNNLFSNIKKSELEKEFIDYRCFYICNNSETNSLYNTSIYLEDEIGAISNCELGVSFSNESQNLNFSSLPTLGSFTLLYQSYSTQPINWNSNSSIFQKNIQDALNDLDMLSGVVVEKFTPEIYVISFLGKDSNRGHDLLKLGSNDLSPNVNISFSKRTQGQPINSIAPLIVSPTSVPNNVQFTKTSSSNRINLGTLNPGDISPIWIRRTSRGVIDKSEKNGFNFALNGSLFED